jgi:glycosyltransferase involved in cell wall biosynthesis
MKVVHFSTSDSFGGSAQSAKRIHQGLVRQGLESKMIVRDKHGDSPLIYPIAPNKYIRGLDRLFDRLSGKIGLQYLFVPSNLFLRNRKIIKQADIFQLYNIHGGYFATSTLYSLSQVAPIVWRLSDLWPITGHCAFPMDCDKYNSGCNICPSLSSYPPISRDHANFLWLHKQSIYHKLDLTIVAPSKWAYKASSQSTLFESFRHVLIPNGIDQTIFYPLDRNEARRSLFINDSRPAILFIAHVAFDNPRKGTDILLAALNLLSQDHDFLLIVVGEKSYEWSNHLSVRVYYYDFTQDCKILSLIYNSCDIVCVPSSSDNLPNTVLEAMACGKPIIASNAGGIMDAVTDNYNGFIFKSSSPSDLARKISFLLTNLHLVRQFGANSLLTVSNHFSIGKELSLFTNLYHQLQEQWTSQKS